jgi:K+ transporter
MGLMIAYVLYRVEPVSGKTLNAVLFDKIAGGWGVWGYAFILFTLISEAAILFVAAQTGFIGGPRVLANMAADRWAPKRLALLSDRLVTMNGVLIMGVSSIVLMVASNGNVGYLVVLYSINVFITFCLAQTGMVKHWWIERRNGKKWFRGLITNGVGLVLTTFILLSVTIIKFNEGGWITLFITGSLVLLFWIIRNNYLETRSLCRGMDVIVEQVEKDPSLLGIKKLPGDTKYDPNERTAVVFVKDYTGIGIKTLYALFKSFSGGFKNIVFVQLGLIDAGAFKGQEEVDKIREKVESQIKHYVDLLNQFGYHAEGVTLYGTDTVEEALKAAKQIIAKHPNSTFFGGQIVFPKNSLLMRLLHNYTLFSIQKYLYEEGIPLFVLPIELTPKL